ncbi:response regulator [Spirosoma sp. KNUC1025]|uniref:response regulator n=1 Tax=Spirosoma sp. KNUC1025 TaxID=2894082 RepID=UPI003863F0D2|nr:response regulator [Spirosoma sp. KNUC1025]
MPLPIDQVISQANFKRAKVLIIEDSADHWMLIRNAMERYLPEINPVHVDTSEKALTLLQDWSTQEWEIPKLIFQDLYLPNRENGWHLLEQIKSMAAPCNRIPVVMLSSSNNRADIEEAYLRGSASYLVKPTNFETWLTYFRELRAYWWETVTLPPMQFSL